MLFLGREYDHAADMATNKANPGQDKLLPSLLAPPPPPTIAPFTPLPLPHLP